MGAAFYDDDECIHCEMCEAITEEEMVQASNRIREYLRTHAVNAKGPIKKIAVCGKGGVGKSTTVNLISNTLMEEGHQVLVLDTDDSNPGLYRTFNFDVQPKPLIRLLSRFSKGDPETNTEWILKDQIAIEDIPPEYILNRNGLKFMMVGKIENPFQGCSCSMANITRDLLLKLVLKDREMALVDMEAGVESFGRGVERSADTVLIIVEPSFESMTLAERIGYMAEGMGINRVRVILNKVPSESTKQKMEEQLKEKRLTVIGTVYYDVNVSEAGFEGKAPDITSKAMKDVRGVIKQLLKEG
jgi:CO dehydrogenase maturation factor